MGETVQKLQTVKIRSRLLSIIYDLLIVFFLTIIITLLLQQLLIHSGLIELEQIPISKDESIAAIPIDSISNKIIKSFWLIISFVYFVHYWTKRGQTPGMKVWKIKVVTHEHSTITLKQASIRYFSALFGMGLVWMLFNKYRLAMQDIASNSLLIKI